MPKRTAILILILSAVTFFLLYSAFRVDTPKPQSNLTLMITPFKRTSTISFDPPSLRIGTSLLPQTASLLVESGSANITGVQIILAFDPKAVKAFKIIPPETNFFGPSTNYTIMKNTVDMVRGKAVYIIAIPPTGKPQKGFGKIGILTFTPNQASRIFSTSISFASDTKITSLEQEQSVLKAANPLTVYFQPASFPKVSK